MSSEFKPDFKTLENNIIDVMKEEQIKLGYRKETIRLYYPMESLSHLLGADLSLNELQNALDGFCSYAEEHLGKLEYSHQDKRFCIAIPEKGAAYVHDEIEDNSFLQDFIEKVSEHNSGIEDIMVVFKQYSDHVICEKVTNGEFDYLIYFEDGNPDSYRYCIKFEDCHTVYHRFTISDYKSFGF